MKKFLSIILSILMLATTQITALAADNFVGSPTANNKPTLIESTSVDGNDYKVVINSFAERDQLNKNQKIDFENAYNSIKNANNLIELNSELKDLADNKNLNVEDLSVSDIFNISYHDNNGNVVDNNGTFKIKVKAATLNNFVGLMHYDGQTWTMVKGAKINADGYLEFTTDYQGTFAVVVDTAGTNTQSPATGASEISIVATLSILACAALIIVKFNSNNKERA